ncbi:MAG TPA: winged helix-turn-helix domain-containing protein [Nitrososphaerales archaeon]|nr:winged helix-turn-helix domain-containing protein [Nitrososphaerales archaeon]
MQESGRQKLLEIRTTNGTNWDYPAFTFDSLERVPLPSLPAKRGQRRAVRSQEEIEASILESCRTPNVQHWIMVKARLGYDTFWKHMNDLLATGLMDERNEGSRTLYQTNAKGLELLEKLTEIEVTVRSL